MADSGLRRRVSTRNRGEPPAKLRKTSPAAEEKPSKAAATPSTRKVSEKKTPGKTTPGKTTPAKSAKSTPRGKVKESPKAATPAPAPEPEDEEPDEPIVQESMATLMEKSRQRWINEGGIFEKFWTKPPRKKKGQPAVDMPTKAQMNLVEIGQTRIIIEPHVFDIHMYGVKKPALSWQTPIAGPLSAGGDQSAQLTPQRQTKNPYPRPTPTTQKPVPIPPTPSSSTTTPAANTPGTSRAVAPNPYAVGQSSGGPNTTNNTPTPAAKPAGNAAQPSQAQATPAPPAKSVTGSSAQPAVVGPATASAKSETGQHSSQPPAEPARQETKPSTVTANEPSTSASASMTTTTSAAAVSTSTPSPAPAPAPASNATQTQPSTAQQTPIPTPTPRAQSARPPQASGSSQQRPKQQQPQQQQQQQQPQQHAPHPDPVIQMLAQRAASDPALKELMKIVAAGSTSPEKLKEFQRHIDDINAIVQQQKQGAVNQLTATTGRGNKRQNQHQQGHGAGQQRQGQQQYRAAAPFIASKPSAPPPPPRHDLGNIVFDFIRGGDCFLLPRQSIIQHMPDGMTTLISFIVTRKGKDVPGARLKAEVEYYQPMTMTLLTVEQKIRDMISQVVLPKEQVNKEMLEVMERCTLAPTRGVMLEVPEGLDAMELDRPADKRVGAESDEADVAKAEWDAPDSLLPM